MELGKVRITFFVAVSTSVGYLFYSKSFDWRMLLIALGVFLLACGSSALNHFQERKTDALMERTKNRPIPSGRIAGDGALLFSLLFSLAGFSLIYFSSNINAALLGILALIWYNLVYTPLKKRFALAVVPGSLIGAIPPVIGWSAAGGSPLDREILALAFFFFVWQIPHFWLLLMMNSGDYERAGFPTLTKLFSERQLGRIIFVWIASLSASCMLIPLYDLSVNLIAVIFMLLSGSWLLWKTRGILSGYLERIIFRRAFFIINFYMLVVVLIISLDKLIFQEF